MSDPMEHVKREGLPWREDWDELTECGRKTIDVAEVVTREEMVAKVKRQGKTRAALSSCMSCWNTMGGYQPWSEDPASAMSRECRPVWGQANERDDRVRRELRAIAALIVAHRDEFDAMVEGLAAVPSLADARKARRV